MRNPGSHPAEFENFGPIFLIGQLSVFNAHLRKYGYLYLVELGDNAYVNTEVDVVSINLRGMSLYIM